MGKFYSLLTSVGIYEQNLSLPSYEMDLKLMENDVFIVGAWNDVIELSVDLQKMFRKYTQGTLSISAGIGVSETMFRLQI